MKHTPANNTSPHCVHHLHIIDISRAMDRREEIAHVALDVWQRDAVIRLLYAKSVFSIPESPKDYAPIDFSLYTVDESVIHPCCKPSLKIRLRLPWHLGGRRQQVFGKGIFEGGERLCREDVVPNRNNSAGHGLQKRQVQKRAVRDAKTKSVEEQQRYNSKVT